MSNLSPPKNKNYIFLSDLDILLNPEILNKNLNIQNYSAEDIQKFC